MERSPRWRKQLPEATQNKKRPKRESLGAKRGRAASRLEESAALDPRTLNISGTRRRRDETESDQAGESPEVEASAPSPAKADTAGDVQADGKQGVDPVQADPGTEEATGTSDASNRLEGEGGGEADSAPPNQEAPAPTSAFQPSSFAGVNRQGKLEVMHLSSTEAIWDRYGKLALNLRKATGQRVKVAVLMRKVVEQHLPETADAVAASTLAGYAERWRQERSRFRSPQRSQTFRLYPRDLRVLDQVQVLLEEDRGTKVPISGIVSGILNEHEPTVAQAKQLLQLR